MKKAAVTSCFAALLGGTMLIAAAPTFLGDLTTSATAEPSAFPQPPVRRSSGSVLRTALHARIAENELVDQISGETKVFRSTTFDGRILGPTLEVRPGETLSIDLVNELPPNPLEQRKGAFPHDPFTINLHTHGLSVSPLGISDNVFRQMEPGTRNRIRIDIPHDHPSGTYWYHPHKHGSATYQVIGGMAGFLIVKGGPGTLDELPEIKAAKDLVMGFQVIRAGVNGDVPFVNQEATQFGTTIGTTDPLQQGVFSTYGLGGAPGRSYFDFTTNGVTNPTLRMRPGEVQRWRMLNAAEAEGLLVALQGHGLNIVAMDGITVSDMSSLQPGTPVVMSPGQRYDILVKADKPGTYLLQALDPATPVSVSPSGIDPAPRVALQGSDFPDPCSTLAPPPCDPATQPKQVSYPVPLATIVVDGDPVDMALPTGPLPVPKSLQSVDTMLNRTPDAVRHVAFEICGQGVFMARPENRLSSCGWYFAKYDEKFWGGLPFNNLLLMRDDDDKGVPSEPFDPNMPRVAFEKEGLFTPEQPLFNNMIAGNYEEWTVVNRSFSDHPFHIHQNPFLLTHINGKALPTPEWHDTLIVPGSIPPTSLNPQPQPNINTNPHSSITFRTYFEPNTAGCFVMHCHIFSHEDVSMMQRLDLLPGPNQPSLCMPEGMSH